MASCANVKARASPHACDRNVNGSSSRAAVPDATQSDQGIARRDGEQRAQADAMEEAEQPGPWDPSARVGARVARQERQQLCGLGSSARDACDDAGHATVTAARHWHQFKNVSCTLFKVAQKANSMIQ